MKITIEAETDAEREHVAEPRTFAMVYEFVLCGYGVTGRFSHFHGDPEFLLLMTEFAKRRLTNVSTPDPR